MRVLIVSYVFPPFNIIGAVRVGKLAKYLDRFGHDVRVIAADALPLERTLRTEISPDRVTYTRWIDVDRPYRALLEARARVRVARRSGNDMQADSGGRARRPQQFDAGKPPLTDRIRRAYVDLVHIPDAAAGWRRFAVRAGIDLTRSWKPDVIVASGAPWTSLLVASDLSRRTGIPWVADFRDLWVDNPDLPRSRWRARTIDSYFERRIVASAAALVTVSEPLAEKLRSRYPEKAVHVVLNGFDADDYASVTPFGPTAGSPTAESAADHRQLRLVYTGQVNRSLIPLWDAVRLLGEDAESIAIEMIGVTNEAVKERYIALAAARGISNRIRWHRPVSHSRAANLQQGADVLFLLVHDTPSDACIYTGKLFEYVGARRPILIVGTSRGVAAELVRSRGLGVAEGAPDAIAAQLRLWLREKRETGAVSYAPNARAEDLSREAQSRAFAAILTHAATQAADAPAGQDEWVSSAPAQ